MKFSEAALARVLRPHGHGAVAGGRAERLRRGVAGTGGGAGDDIVYIPPACARRRSPTPAWPAPSA